MYISSISHVRNHFKGWDYSKSLLRNLAYDEYSRQTKRSWDDYHSLIEYLDQHSPMHRLSCNIDTASGKFILSAEAKSDFEKYHFEKQKTVKQNIVFPRTIYSALKILKRFFEKDTRKIITPDLIYGYLLLPFDQFKSEPQVVM